MLRVFVVLIVSLALAQPPQPTPADLDKLLAQIEQLAVNAKKIRDSLPPPIGATVDVPAGGDLQQAIDLAPPGTTITLAAGATYHAVTIAPHATYGASRKLRLTTKGHALDRLISPADASSLATIQGTSSFGLYNTASDVEVVGLRFAHNLPSGQGDMIRCGDPSDPDVSHVPSRVTIRQVLLQGSTAGEPTNSFGQKRGIAANCQDMLIDQVWIEDVFQAGQESHCIISWATPGRVTTRRSFLSCGSINYMVGGTPPPSPDHLPEDMVLEDSVLYKPMKWKGATPARVVKNLYEVKFGRRLTARRNLLYRHWQQAQPGASVVITMATGADCSFCELTDVTFTDNIVVDVSAGVNILGHVYSIASHTVGAGQAKRITISGNYFKISKAQWGGQGWPMQIGSEPKDITVERNTFVFDGNSFVNAYYGSKWPFGEPKPLPAGPVTGFRFVDNVMSTHSNYGVFTPNGTAGTGIATYFPGIVMGGNVIPGAPSGARARYDALDGEPNIYPASIMIDAKGCVPAHPGKGADCTTLPWALAALVP